jgi:hypothetical protein
MKRIICITYLLSALFFILNYGCDDTITTDDLDKKIIPDKDVSYSQHIQPVLNLKCASAGCHDDATRADGLSLTSWSNTTADPSVVARGEPDNSKLVWTIEAQASVSPMPPIGYPPLTVNQINGIKTWIREGANNN